MRPSVEGDIDQLKDRLRRHDLLDIALVRKSPEEALRSGFEKGIVCYTLMVGDEPIGMAGLSLGIDYAFPWLLGTDRISDREVWRRFARESRLWFDQFVKLSDGRPMTNFLSPENVLHMRWLEWLGCSLEDCGHFVRLHYPPKEA